MEQSETKGKLSSHWPKEIKNPYISLYSSPSSSTGSPFSPSSTSNYWAYARLGGRGAVGDLMSEVSSSDSKRRSMQATRDLELPWRFSPFFSYLQWAFQPSPQILNSAFKGFPTVSIIPGESKLFRWGSTIKPWLSSHFPGKRRWFSRYGSWIS